MRHSNRNKKFGRKTDERRALMRSLVVSLIDKEQIKTTEARAKAIRPRVEKLVTRSKNPTVANKRIVNSRINSPKNTKKLFDVLGPKYKDRKGGYTRIVKMPNRKSDGASMAVIQFV